MSVFRKAHKVEEGVDAWLMTYADMITLILCFFVIMLSVSEPKMDKFEKLKQKLQGGFITQMIEVPFAETFRNLQELIEVEEVEKDISVERAGRIITLDMTGDAFFAAGSADIKEEAKPLLDKLIATILDAGMKEYTVEVEGHTDNVEIASAQFPSNWELSAARGTAVVRFLIGKGMDPKRMKATAYGEVRPKVPNLDEKGNPIPENQAQNRRVVIKIESKQ